jgi:hypothetical protein
MAIIFRWTIALTSSFAYAGELGRPEFPPLREGMDKPMEENGRRLRSNIDTIHAETGQRLKFEYDALLADGLTTMSIDSMQQILRVSCGQGFLELEIDTTENAQALMRKIEDIPDLLITGRSEWGCSIMHNVYGVRLGKTSRKLRLQTSKARLQEVFENLKLSMVSPQVGQRAEPESSAQVFPDREVAIPDGEVAIDKSSQSAQSDDKPLDNEAKAVPPRRLCGLWGDIESAWSGRRRWSLWSDIDSAWSDVGSDADEVAGEVASEAGRIASSIADGASKLAADVEYVADHAGQIWNETKALADDVFSALGDLATGTINTDNTIPIPLPSAPRWNVDADDNVIEEIIPYGDSPTEPGCKDCYFYVGASVHVEISIAYFELVDIEFYLKGSIKGQLSIAGSVGGSEWLAIFESFGISAKSSYNQTLTTITCPSINFLVGPVPFNIGITLPITVGADITLTGSKGQPTYDFKVWAGASIEMGFKLNSDYDFLPIHTVDYDYGFDIQAVPPDGSLTLTAYLQPSISFTIDHLGGPVNLAERIGLSATGFGAKSDRIKSGTCPSGSDFFTLDLELQTLLTPSVTVKITIDGFSKILYQHTWPTIMLLHDTVPLTSGCLEVSADESDGWRRLSANSKLSDPRHQPLSTGTSFRTEISPRSNRSDACLKPEDYPEILMTCTLLSAVDPHDTRMQEKAVSGGVSLRFICKQLRKWRLNATTNLSSTNSTKTVQVTEFYQMQYELGNGQFKPVVSSQHCEDFSKTNLRANRSNPCYVYMSSGRNQSTIPKNIGDISFNATIFFDHIYLSGDSTTNCFELPARLRRPTNPNASVPSAQCDAFKCSSSNPINKGNGVACSGGINTCNAETCCRTLAKGEISVSKVALNMRMAGMEYSKVVGNYQLQSGIVDKIKDAVVASMGNTSSDINVTLSPGSVYAIVKIAPPSGTDVSTTQAKAMQEKTAITTEVLAQVKTLPLIESVTANGDASDINVTSDDPFVTQVVETSGTTTSSDSASSCACGNQLENPFETSGTRLMAKVFFSISSPLLSWLVAIAF